MADYWMSQKRKRTVVYQQKKEAQTVRRSKILQSPLITGISLSREHGASRAQILEARTASIAKQSEVSELLSLKSCEHCGRRDTVFDFAIDKENDSILWGLGSSTFGRLQYLSETSSTYEMAAFRSSISSLSVTNHRTVVATATAASHPGNVFIAGLSEPSGEIGSLPILDTPAPSYMLLGHPETDLWTSSPNPPGGRDIVAIGGSEQTYMLGAEGRLLQTYDVGCDVRAIDWLSPTVAIGGTRKKTVLLWDARTGGSSARFHHSSGVTAIRSLGNGSQMLVCGFDGMGLYDVRMPRAAGRTSKGTNPKTSPAVLRIPFKTERPSVAMDVSQEANLVATGDDVNVIQLHSLLTGRLVGELGKADDTKNREYMTRLRFVECSDGKPTLMACQGADLLEWSWGGAEDDED